MAFVTICFIIGFLIDFHFHMMLPIFSPNLGIAVLKSLQPTFSVHLGFLLKYEYVLTTDEWVFFQQPPAKHQPVASF